MLDPVYCTNPTCRKVLNPGLQRCPYCGTDQSAPWQQPHGNVGRADRSAPDNRWTCPRCGAIASADTRACPRCGFDSASSDALILQELRDEYVKLVRGRALGWSHWWWTTGKLNQIRMQVAQMGIAPDSWEAGLRPRLCIWRIVWKLRI